MAPSRVYLKGPVVKNLLLDNDVSCEEKLEKLSEMVGVPYQKPPSNENVDSNTNNLVTVTTEPDEEIVNDDLQQQQFEQNQHPIDQQETEETTDNKENLVSDRDISVEKIVAGLTGRQLSHARSIIQSIEKSTQISWDYNTLEIIIRNEFVPHSNLKVLLEKIVQVEPKTLPVGLALFIYNLIEIQCSVSHFKSADSLNIRSNLLKIKKNNNLFLSEKNNSYNETSLNNSENNSNVQTEEQQSSNDILQPSDETVLPVRRKRKQSSVIEDEPPEIQEITTADNENLPSLRRSKRLRLKEQVRSGWLNSFEQ